MTFRAIHTKIWKDAWFLELDPEGKLLFMYLCTNELTNVLGLYELSPRVAAFETGLSLERTRGLLDAFRTAGKIDSEGGWIWIHNLLRYNIQNPRSPKQQKYINRILDGIPNGGLKAAFVQYYTEAVPYLYGIDTEPHGIDTAPYIHRHDMTLHDQDKTLHHHDTGAAAPEPHDDDVSNDAGNTEPEPQTEQPDQAAVTTAVLALLERNWNAGEKKAAEFAVKWGPRYIVDMCEHAKRVGLEAGWIRECAGSFTPGQKWESRAERQARVKNRGPTSLEIMDSLERMT